MNMKNFKNTTLLVLFIFVISIGKSQNATWQKRNYYGYNDTIAPNFLSNQSTPFEFNGKIYTGLDLSFDFRKIFLFRYNILNDKWETINHPYHLFKNPVSWFTFQNKLYVIANDSSATSSIAPTFIFDYNPETGIAIKKGQTPISGYIYPKIQNCNVGNAIYFLQDSFLVYEPLLDKWTLTSTSTQPYTKVNTTVSPNLGPNMCSLNNEIYIFNDSIWSYLPSTGNWINKGKTDYKLTSRVGVNSQCSSFNNKIYFPKEIYDKFYSSPGNYSSLIEYNPTNGSIQEKARNWGEDGIQLSINSFTQTPFISSSVLYSGKMYCFSNCSGGFYEYDFQSDSFYLKANYTGFLKYGTHPFSIGSKIYYGSEYGLAFSRNYWSFDTLDNKWTRIADLPTFNRGFGAFSINDKGYIIQEIDNSDTLAMFQYSPSSNTWINKRGFTGNRMNGYGLFLTVGNDMYTGTSLYELQTNNTAPIPSSKFWKYESATDSWVQKTNVPGNPRYGAIGFSLNGKVYIGGGISFDGQGNPIVNQDFWEYTPSTNSWSPKAMIPINTGAQYAARSLSMNNEGYMILSAIILKYEPIINKWDTLYSDLDLFQPKPNSIRDRYIVGAASIGDKIFAISSDNNTSYIPRFHEFGVFPSQNPTAITENKSNNTLNFYPNPSNGILFIESNTLTNITIIDINGKILLYQTIDKKGQIDISSLSSGMYLLRTKEGVTRKFIKE